MNHVLLSTQQKWQLEFTPMLDNLKMTETVHEHKRIYLLYARSPFERNKSPISPTK